MRVNLILADAAQTDPNGKAHILGAGWSRSPAAPAAMAVVVFIELDWSEANVALDWDLTLTGADGEPVALPGPAGPQTIALQGKLEGGRPAGMTPGSPIVLAPLSVNVPPTPLEPGRYEWRFTITGGGLPETVEHRSFDKAAP